MSPLAPPPPPTRSKKRKPHINITSMSVHQAPVNLKHLVYTNSLQTQALGFLDVNLCFTGPRLHLGRKIQSTFFALWWRVVSTWTTVAPPHLSLIEEMMLMLKRSLSHIILFWMEKLMMKKLHSFSHMLMVTPGMLIVLSSSVADLPQQRAWIITLSVNGSWTNFPTILLQMNRFA